MTITINGVEYPFTMAVVPLLLAELDTCDLHALRWCDMIRAELRRRTRVIETPADEPQQSSRSG